MSILKSSARRLRHSSNRPVTLAQNAEHIFALNHAMIHMPTGAIFSYVPKNACSTMRFSFAVANGCVDKQDEVGWIHANNLTFQPTLREAVCAPYTFLVLRCPFERLASVYLDKIVGGYEDGWSLFQPVRLGDDNPQDLSFEDFVNRATSAETLRANLHWRPQTDYILYKAYDDVFTLSDMEKMTQTVKEKIGLEIIDTRASLKHDRGTLDTVSGDFSKTPALHLALMRREGKVPTTRSLYTEALMKKVRHEYRMDFNAFVNMAGKSPTLSEDS